jgi:myo-inositol-1(or 4)-monophosphatase
MGRAGSEGADTGPGMVGEPRSGRGGGGPSEGWLWVIDPLDGTTNYLHGYPMYSVSIAALCDGELAVGVVVHGVTGETWTAVRGHGAYLDERPIHVSSTTRMSNALIGTGFPFRALDVLPVYVQQFRRVIHATAGLRRGGSAALDLCHVASGYFDAFWEHRLAPWDVAAGTLIIREAGGVVTQIDGDPDVLHAGSLLAGNPHVHAAMLSILNESGT